MYHKAVMVKQVISYLKILPGGTYVDATFGGGGHTQAILEADPTCKVVALDWDTHAFEHGQTLKDLYGDRLQFIWGNFADMVMLFKKHHISRVNGIIADFGTSQFQINTAPGFSFTLDAPLDMRMSPAHSAITAAHILNEASEKELSDIFYLYGEERQSRRIARAILLARKKRELRTTRDLVAVITSVMPPRHRGIHPATRVFQALRIAVNHELENIERLLQAIPHLLLPQGRAVCISFHSLEDRLVKQFIRNNGEIVMNLTPKIVIADDEEVELNRSSRSAKLRACELLSKELV